jgi:MYXO-CTERM domain-containing protein
MNDEFIDLHNKSSAAVNIAGWQVMLSNDLGQTTLAATIGSGVTIPAARFYLLANKAAQGYSGSVAPDATYTSPIADDGGIALFDENSAIVDQVGMSTGSAYFEGTPLSAMMANANQSYERNFGGCSPNQDMDNNSADFRFNATTSFPQNAAVSCSPCTGVKCSEPLNNQCFPATGTCNASTGECVYKMDKTGTACDDGDPCTTSDKCDATGTCAGLTPTTCVTPPAAFCSDATTLATFDAAGSCTPGVGCAYTQHATNCPNGCDPSIPACAPPCSTSCSTPPTCFDAAGTCNLGKCTYPKSAQGTTCDDGDDCTTNDVCDGKGGCTPGAEKAIDDNDPCTVDACDSTTGTVSHTAVADGINCDDGDLCNGIATCSSGVCVNGAAVSCTTPPIGGCTASTGTCASNTGVCTYAPIDIGTACDDNDKCTTSDKCDGNGACTGTAVTCTPPAPSCTTSTVSHSPTGGVCDTTTGGCTFQGTDTTCANGCDGATGLCKNATDGGAGGSGGTSSIPDAGTGGTSSIPDASSGGTTGAPDASSSGGSTSVPDAGSGGGSTATGGSGGATTGTGGASGATSGTGGSGGPPAGSGGGSGTTGTAGSGGSSGTTGTAGSGGGGIDAGTGAFSGGGGGCGCSVPGRSETSKWPLSLVAVALFAARRRKKLS